MPNGDMKCVEHSMCVSKITSLENENHEQWEEMKEQRKRINSILMRLNIILGSIVVATIILAIK